MSRQCSVCDRELTDETGWGFTTTLAEGAPYIWYCGDCAPDNGKGYTLADFEAMKAENQVARDMRQVALMDQLGPDVYFAVKGALDAKQRRAECRRTLQRQQRAVQGIVDKLEQLGVVFVEDERP